MSSPRACARWPPVRDWSFIRTALDVGPPNPFEVGSNPYVDEVQRAIQHDTIHELMQA